MDPESLTITIMLLGLAIFCIIMSLGSKKEGIIFTMFALICSLVLFFFNWIIGLILIVLCALLMLSKTMDAGGF